MKMNQFQEYIHLSRYARWRDDLGRRETWEETVDRYCDFMRARYQYDTSEIRNAIAEMEVMPSMRALMTAGPALERDHMAAFNCSYIPIDSLRAFDEVMYILLCGTGVGFSVERQLVAKLPIIAETMHDTDTTIIVSDSKIGWASSFRELLSLLWAGKVPKWDMSRVRPAGARLRTFGGRASGPGPLDILFRFAVSLVKKSSGRKLTSLECHDLVCKVADVVVVGGVRRSALLSASNVSDDRMRNAKNGQWWLENPQRALANNSAAYTEKTDFEVFLKEFFTLYESRSGERGIFNRIASAKKVAENGRREPGYDWGTNPCGEIILRPYGLCNLSEVVVRPTDELDDLKRKVRLAAIIGTLQSDLTDFRYVRSVWKNNADEERLLGVSLTGIMDHPCLSSLNEPKLSEWLEELKQEAIRANRECADMLGISPSSAITCVKPSGTVSQLVNSSSGIHPRYAPYYIRTIRADVKDPLARYMRDAGVPCEPCVLKSDSTLVFSFPVASPEGSVIQQSVSAREQLELYLIYRRYWCEHNPSITVSYKDSEFLGIGQWVWDHWDEIGGISFLPYTDHIYQQAPYQPITKEEYQSQVSNFPKLDWSNLSRYEKEDQTTHIGELACSAGICEL